MSVCVSETQPGPQTDFNTLYSMHIQMNSTHCLKLDQRLKNTAERILLCALTAYQQQRFCHVGHTLIMKEDSKILKSWSTTHFISYSGVFLSVWLIYFIFLQLECTCKIYGSLCNTFCLPVLLFFLVCWLLLFKR